MTMSRIILRTYMITYRKEERGSSSIIRKISTKQIIFLTKGKNA